MESKMYGDLSGGVDCCYQSLPIFLSSVKQHCVDCPINLHESLPASIGTCPPSHLHYCTKKRSMVVSRVDTLRGRIASKMYEDFSGGVDCFIEFE
jgi:hypothetical protein